MTGATTPMNDGSPIERPPATSSRITIPQIARRLEIGRVAVYKMLDHGIIPGIRLGRKWIVTRHAYEQWEHTCGTAYQGNR